MNEQFKQQIEKEAEKEYPLILIPLTSASIEYNSLQRIKRAAYIAGASRRGWVSVEDEKPPKLKRVFILVETPRYSGTIIQQTAIAEYVPFREVPESEYMNEDYFVDVDYDEEKDEYFAPEGFYVSNLCEDTHWKVIGKVVAWQPLPPAPIPSQNKKD